MYITKYGCVFLKLGESIYVAMDLIPILLGSLPLAHNAQHSLVMNCCARAVTLWPGAGGAYEKPARLPVPGLYSARRAMAGRPPLCHIDIGHTHRLRDPRSFAEVGARATCVGVQENAWKGTSPEVNTIHLYNSPTLDTFL